MQFIRSGDVYKVVSITGPTHNFLALKFGGQEGGAIEVDAMDIKPDEPKRLTAAEIETQVKEGVEAANAAHGTSYHLRQIQFVPSDSPPAATYRDLAEKLVERLARNEAFTVAEA